MPGKHYCVVEHQHADCIVLPDDAVLKTFRQRWVLQRNNRPMVPVFQRSKLPRPGLPGEENARLCSVYFRPWTLCASHATAHVPHLLQLALCPRVHDVASAAAAAAAPRRPRLRAKSTPPRSKTAASDDAPMPPTESRLRLRGKSPAPPTMSVLLDEPSPPSPSASWSASWNRYIRGNVVSEHARRLITNFLTATLARTAADDDSTDDEVEQEREDDVPFPGRAARRAPW